MDTICSSETELFLPPAFTLVSCSAYFFDPGAGGDIYISSICSPLDSSALHITKSRQTPWVNETCNSNAPLPVSLLDLTENASLFNRWNHRNNKRQRRWMERASRRRAGRLTDHDPPPQRDARRHGTQSLSVWCRFTQHSTAHGHTRPLSLLHLLSKSFTAFWHVFLFLLRDIV
jgi:hypothetical protein